jgi:hypothetical protein
MRIVIAITVVMVLSMPAISHAGQSPNARTSQMQWAVSDKCSRTAIAKNPDHTSEALAKREQDLRQCNVANRLPARAPLTPPQAPQN